MVESLAGQRESDFRFDGFEPGAAVHDEFDIARLNHRRRPRCMLLSNENVAVISITAVGGSLTTQAFAGRFDVSIANEANLPLSRDQREG